MNVEIEMVPWVVDNRGRKIRPIYSPQDRANAPGDYDRIFPKNGPHVVQYFLPTEVKK